MNTTPRFRRGDTSPLRPGLVFYGYHLGLEQWRTPEQVRRFRERNNRNARLQRKRNPAVHKRAFAKWLAKPGKLELKRQCYKNWLATPEGRKVRREITARYIATPNGAIINRVRSRIAQALKKGGTQSAATLELIGCTIPELRQHLEKHFLLGMSWENMGTWEIDHITPLALFDLRDPQQQRLAFNFHNQCPLWKPDNRAKSDLVQRNGQAVRASELRKIIPFQQQAA